MKSIKKIITWYLLIVTICLIGRLVFYLVYYSVIKAAGETGLFSMLWHGLVLDVAIAGYLTILPMLLMIVLQWWNGRSLLWTWRVHQALAMTALALAFSANIALYRYWGFPLDTTPLFFLENSPQEFIACLNVWQMILGPIGLILLIAALYFAADAIIQPRQFLGGKRDGWQWKRSVGMTFVYLLLGGVMFIGIRGGLTVSVNNVGKVYFSDNTRLNHAAVNPLFSFFDSMGDEEDFAEKYRYLDGKEADRLFSQLTYTAQRETPDSLLTPTFYKALQAGKTGRGEGVRVVIIVMESFSRFIMGDGLVKGVTPNLDRLAREGVYFTNFYANSFRTDRGLMAILSGFPAQPTMSLMKYPHKTNNLYSIARSLKNDGFATRYVYGGDANFTNCRSYLLATGFENIVAEEDYDLSIERGKWGVNDEDLFNRALEEAERDKPNQNVFRVIQTSSSHEPFEVPWHRFKDDVLNAFNYTDNCIGQYIKKMHERKDWDRTLILLVPDHQGCYPEDIDNGKTGRYRIPLIMTGGAITQARQIATVGAQQDIAATLLALLGVQHQEFTYSKDMLDPECPHFAFFTVPDLMGMVTDDNALIFDNVSQQTLLDEGVKKSKNLRPAQAYLQKLYDDIASR